MDLSKLFKRNHKLQIIQQPKKRIYKFPVDQIEEREAIFDYLRDYWTVSLKDLSLKNLIDGVLDKGIERGIAHREEDLLVDERVLKFRSSIEKYFDNYLSENKPKIQRLTPKDYVYEDFQVFMDKLISNVEDYYPDFLAKPNDYYFYDQMRQSVESKIQRNKTTF